MVQRQIPSVNDQSKGDWAQWLKLHGKEQEATRRDGGNVPRRDGGVAPRREQTKQHVAGRDGGVAPYRDQRAETEMQEGSQGSRPDEDVQEKSRQKCLPRSHHGCQR